MKPSALAALIVLVLSCLFTENVFAQDNAGSSAPRIIAIEDAPDCTMAGKFGGSRLTFDLMFGSGRWDDKVWINTDDDWNEEGTGFGAQLQIQYGYFWGSRVFVGPVASISGGIPMFLNGSVGVEVIVPFNASNAISASAGVGGTWRTDYMYEYGQNGLRALYFPFQLSFEHVFDNHFILGITCQINLTIQATDDEYDDVFENGQYTYRLVKESENSAAMGFFGAGIRLGYAF